MHEIVTPNVAGKLNVKYCIKDVLQLCLCATWPRRPAGYNNNIPIPLSKDVPDPF